MNTKLRQFFIFFIGLGVSIGLDQFTKHLAVVHLKGQKHLCSLKVCLNFIILKTVALLLECCRDGRDSSS